MKVYVILRTASWRQEIIGEGATGDMRFNAEIHSVWLDEKKAKKEKKRLDKESSRIYGEHEEFTIHEEEVHE
jgi:hypothetical protein